MVQSVTARPLVVDVVLAAGLTVVSTFQGLDDVTGQWRPFDAAAVVLTAATTLPTVARRRAPMTVFFVCCGFWLLLIGQGYNPIVTTYGALLALYSVAAGQPSWRTFIALATCGVLWTYAGALTRSTSILSLLLQSLVVPAVIWKVADGARQLDRTNQRLAEANAQLLLDREERAQRAVVDERVRIARELHDVVAHHMSVVAVQAGLARYVLRSDPDTAHAAIDTVLRTSTESLDEMRRMLALLRVDPEPYDPAPSLSNLPELVERIRAAGVPVTVDVTGRLDRLSPGLQLCAYRVIQESLTNVLKHAAPAKAEVALTFGPREFVAVVRDDGRPPAHPGPPGQGLNGMRERASLYGGTVTAGPRPAGGFEVRLALPMRDDQDGGPR